MNDPLGDHMGDNLHPSMNCCSWSQLAVALEESLCTLYLQINLFNFHEIDTNDKIDSCETYNLCTVCMDVCMDVRMYVRMYYVRMMGYFL